MPTYVQWLLAAAALVVLAPVALWLGRGLGKKAARALPGLGGVLWLMMAFVKLDPPPPPRAERMHRDEEDAGAPPAP